jgi:hypothetical protein
MIKRSQFPITKRAIFDYSAFSGRGIIPGAQGSRATELPRQGRRTGRFETCPDRLPWNYQTSGHARTRAAHRTEIATSRPAVGIRNDRDPSRPGQTRRLPHTCQVSKWRTGKSLRLYKARSRRIARFRQKES